MILNNKGDDIFRFKYHGPVPNFYKEENPQKPLKIISKELLVEFEKLAIQKGFSGIFYSYLDEKDLDKFQKDSKYVIILKFPITDDILEMEPSKQKCKDMDDEFQLIAHKLYELSDFLRKNGFASELINPVADDLSIKALAIKSNEAILTRSNMCLFEDGLTMSLFPLVCSIKNLPIKTENNLKWVKDYCSTCGLCIENCPHQAFDENELIIAKKCPAHKEGCSDCILICPFFKSDFDKLKLKVIKLKDKGLL